MRYRKRWYLQRSQDALKHRRAKAAASKRARRLKKLPADQQIHEMAEYLRKRLPPDEAYFCSDDHLKRMAIRELRQLELTLAAPATALDSTIPSALNHHQPLRGFRRWFRSAQNPQ